MTRRHSLAILLALMMTAPACSDPEPTPLPPPVPTKKKDMSAADMTSTSDMSGDMSADMATEDMGPADMGPADMGPADMGQDMAADMGEDMPVDMCEPKSEVDLCAEYGFECGKLEVMECGQMRVVENCGGGCPSPALCEDILGEGDVLEGTKCECSPENAAQICANVGKLCGQIDNLPAGVCDTLPACNEYCVDSMAAGDDFNCAVGSGKLRCWGNNGKGQLGLDDTTARKNPDEEVMISIPVISSATGGAHTCVILEDNSLICWGDNDKGQLGVGTSVGAKKPDLSDANSRAFPKDSGIAKVVAGETHTCALIDTDYNPAAGAPAPPYSTYCWGNNELGIVGNTGFAVNSTIAVPVLVDGLLDNVYDISAGAKHTCAIIDAGDPNAPANREVVCWGSTTSNQTGAMVVQQLDYSTGLPGSMDDMGPTRREYPYIDSHRESADEAYVSAPVRVQDPNVQQVVDITKMNAAVDYGIQSGAPFVGEFQAIASGSTFSCVTDQNQEVWCWGVMPFKHARGSCEDPHKEVEPANCTVWPPGDLWPNLNASRFWPVVPMVDHSRDNTTKARRIETSGNKVGLPSGGLDFIAVAARPIRIEHQTDPLSLPTGIGARAKVKATHFAAHNEHMCMLVEEPNTNKTNVYCLGHNQFGEVGNGTNSPTSRVSQLRGDVNGNVVRATALELGDRHSCAIVDDSNIKCWGSNRSSQIGNENLMQDESFRPFDVLLR